MNKNDPQVEERKDLNYDASRKQKSSEKTARIPIKIVPLQDVLKKPDWIRVDLRRLGLPEPRHPGGGARTFPHAAADVRLPGPLLPPPPPLQPSVIGFRINRLVLG